MLQKANQGRDSVTVDRMRSACRQRHRRCRFVCVTYRKAYTTYKVDEVCNGTVQLDVVRFMDREGDAVGSQSGLTLGSPLLKGTSTSSRSQNDAQPTEVARRVCVSTLLKCGQKSHYLSPLKSTFSWCLQTSLWLPIREQSIRFDSVDSNQLIRVRYGL